MSADGINIIGTPYTRLFQTQTVNAVRVWHDLVYEHFPNMLIFIVGFAITLLLTMFINWVLLEVLMSIFLPSVNSDVEQAMTTRNGSTLSLHKLKLYTHSERRKNHIKFSVGVISAFLFIALFLITLDLAAVNIKQIAILTGVIGVVFLIAAKGPIANLSAGFELYLLCNFVVGDEIIINDGLHQLHGFLVYQGWTKTIIHKKDQTTGVCYFEIIENETIARQTVRVAERRGVPLLDMFIEKSLQKFYPESYALAHVDVLESRFRHGIEGCSATASEAKRRRKVDVDLGV